MKQELTSMEVGDSRPGSSGYWSPATLLAESIEAWQLSRRAVLLIVLVPVVIALAGAFSAVLGKEAYKWFTGEDRFAETMQVVFYLSALVMALIVARRQWRLGHRGLGLLFVGLGLALFFLVGEELSWGQRIFGWTTATDLADINKQAETNVHNIYGVGSTFKWVQMLVGAYGAFLPLLVWRWRRLKPYRPTLTALVPHYTLILYFAPLFVWRLYRNLLEPPEQFYFVVSEYNEVLELALALGMALFTIFELRATSREAANRRAEVKNTASPGDAVA